MRIELDLKCQWNLGLTSHLEKVTNTQKLRHGSLMQNFFAVAHFSYRRRGKNIVRKMSRPRLLDKEKQNVMLREEANTDLELSYTFLLNF